MRSQVRERILREDNILILTRNFFRVMRVSTRDVSSTPIIKQSAKVSERGRGRDRDRDLKEDIDPLERDVAQIVADRVILIRNPYNVSIVVGIITSLRSVGRNLVALMGTAYQLTLLPRVKLLMLDQPLSLVLLISHSVWFFCIFHYGVVKGRVR